MDKDDLRSLGTAATVAFLVCLAMLLAACALGVAFRLFFVISGV